ncbi:MAG: hypothetical protein F6J87_07650 [Spirulina sp. SIO3F2]|nr:hypothetical protein [Spirulina sp. SIO3F2]
MSTAAQPDPLDNALADLEQQFEAAKNQSVQDTPVRDASTQPSPNLTENSLDAELAAITAQFPTQIPPNPNLDRALDDQALQMRQQQHRAWGAEQKQKVIEQRAQVWLDELDPYSDEGLWFTEFAEDYPSALDAAIEYLRSLE